MLCPRCSDAEINEASECPTCGFSPVVKEGTDPQRDPFELVVVAELGDAFALQALLHREQWSAVYLVKPAGREQLWALKAMFVPGRISDDHGERFRAELSTAALHRHPNIVPVHQYGVCRSFVWCAMEHVPGTTFATSLSQPGERSVEACGRMVNEVAAALDYVHRRGGVHGDLKPANILIDANGLHRVSDFGARRALNAEVDAVPAGDQFALAVIACRFLTGSTPTSGVLPPPHFQASIPDHTAAALVRALDPEPANRFATVGEFAAAFNQAVPADESVPVAAGVPRRTPPAGVAGPRKTPPAVETRRSVPGVEVLLPVPEAGQEVPVEAPQNPWPAILLGAMAVLILGGGVAGWVFWRMSNAVPVVGGLPPQFVSAPVQAPPPPPVVERPVDTSAPAPSSAPIRRSRPTGATPAQTQRPVALGELSVNSTPWGQLFIDDSLIGNTPKAGLVVPAGRHSLRIIREGFLPFEQTIEVRPSEKLRLTDIVLAPRNP